MLNDKIANRCNEIRPITCAFLSPTPKKNVFRKIKTEGARIKRWGEENIPSPAKKTIPKQLQNKKADIL